MSLRNITARQRRISEYHALLATLLRRELPWVCEVPSDIEKLLALNSAALLEARFDVPIVARSGDKYIPRAVVTGVTAEGRMLLHKVAQASVREMNLPAIGLASATSSRARAAAG